jgi:hypothetical protein
MAVTHLLLFLIRASAASPNALVDGALGGSLTTSGRPLYDAKLAVARERWRVDLAARRTGLWENWPSDGNATCDVDLPPFAARDGHTGRMGASLSTTGSSTSFGGGLAVRWLLETTHNCAVSTSDETSGFAYQFNQRALINTGALGFVQSSVGNFTIFSDAAIFAQRESVTVLNHLVDDTEGGVDYNNESEIKLSPSLKLSGSFRLTVERRFLNGNLGLRPTIDVDYARIRTENTTIKQSSNLTTQGTESTLTNSIDSVNRWDTAAKLEINALGTTLKGTSVLAWSQLESSFPTTLPNAVSFGTGLRYTRDRSAQ